MTTYQLLVRRGFEEGMDEGIQTEKKNTIKKMLKFNIAKEQIAAILGVSMEFITQVAG